MKKLFLIIAVLTPFLNYGYEKNRIEHRFLIGPGATAAMTDAGFRIGGTFRFDFVIKKNLNAGIKYILTPDNTKDVFLDGIKTKYRGHDFLVNGNCSYYLIGDNQKSKFGLYPTLGAGYWNHTLSTFTVYTNNKSREHTSIQKGLMTSLALGMDSRMGAGRLFVDATVFLNIKGQDITRIYDASNPTMNSETIAPMSFKFVTTFFFNLGYCIKF